MEPITRLKLKAKRDYDNSVCLMSIIPSLAFVYLLVGKIASFETLVGEAGSIMLAIIALILLGIITGKKILWILINKLIDFSEKIIVMERDLVDKSRLAAVTETVLSLGHEINNPLVVLQGSLALLEGDFSTSSPEGNYKERISQMKIHCERIREVMDKMAHISRPVSATIVGQTKMIDLPNSE